MDVPAAGASRTRQYGPRELLSRTGSSALAPALHPRSADFFASIPRDENPRGEHTTMRVHRIPSAPCLQSNMALHLKYEDRSAGVGGLLQTAKTRYEFKANSIAGQFSNEEVSSMPISKKMFQPLRSDTSICQPHQKATSGLRRDLERMSLMPPTRALSYHR
mmetsp:Transcript_36814/g.64863  ORF Transcript_36814/g.64863 Transcript_36814/m.64863 type:complete len:162 (-) Transcript_36814:121-606(-)